MTSKQMLKTKLPSGMHFENVAPLGYKPNWKVVPTPESWGKIRAALSRGAGQIVLTQ